MTENTHISRLTAALPSDIDALIVTSEVSIRYLTGFYYTDGFLLITHDKSYVFTDFRYIEAARAKVVAGFEIILLEGRKTAQLADYIKNLGIKTILYEDKSLTCSALDAYKTAFPGVEWHPCGALIENLRRVKNDCEIEQMKKAQQIADSAFESILTYINPERTELEVALELEFTMRRLGSEGVAFDTIAVSGSASSMPHGVPRPVKLERGFLTMDFGAVCDGYRSDMTRTVCLGKPDDEMRRVYATVLEAQTEALKAYKPGALCSEVDGVAREIIYAAGYKGCFGHSLGHGVGIEIHEAPSVSPLAGTVRLEEGNIVTDEPGIYIEGKYGVRIEDMLAVRDGGVYNFAQSPKELLII